MNRVERHRRRAPIGAEMLESRQLLNAHFARPTAAHVHTLGASAPSHVTGVLVGTSSYTENPINSNFGSDQYTVSGLSTMGKVSATGGDHYISKSVNKLVDHDLYYAGDWTLTLGSGATIDVNYTGHGPSAAITGPFSETLHGTAVISSGAFSGQQYTFDATVVGANSGATKVNFTLS